MRPVERVKAIGKLITVISMAAAYMALFYNASVQEDGEDLSDAFSERINWLIFSLTLLVGMNQCVEMHDHVAGHGSDHSGHQDASASSSQIQLSLMERDSPEETTTDYQRLNDDAKTPSPCRALSCKTLPYIAVVGTLGGFACYAFWPQSYSAAGGDLPFVAPLFALNLLRFALLPGRHAIALVTGNEQKLMRKVTLLEQDEERPIQPLTRLQKVGKAGFFLLFTAGHVVDSQLLANKAQQQSVVHWLSVLGLSSASACYHVNHTLNLGAAWRRYQRLSLSQKCLSFFIAIGGGILHASQPALGLRYLIVTNSPEVIQLLQILAVLIEAFLGGTETLQHASEQAVRATLWMNPPRTRVQQEADAEDKADGYYPPPMALT
jgi:hypothetical protein